MVKRILLIITAVLLSFLAAEAQDYSCYEALREKGLQYLRAGDRAKAKQVFMGIEEHCGKENVPPNNDLKKLIQSCAVTITLSTNQMYFQSNDMESKCVTVTTSAKSFTVGNVPDWCHIAVEGNRVCVTCDANDQNERRSGYFSIYAGGRSMNVGVSQEAGELTFFMDTERLDFSSGNETQTVFVSTNTSNWTVEEPTPYWVDVRFDFDDPTLLHFTSAVNNESKPREGVVNIVVSDQLFPLKVVQAGADTLMRVSCEELVFPKEGTEDAFLVTSNAEGWQVLPSDDWMLISVVNDSVKVNALENTTVFSRHGSVKVGLGTHFREIPVHQWPQVSEFIEPVSEFQDLEKADKTKISVSSVPSDLKVLVIGDASDTLVRHTPFTLPADYKHHTLQMGFEHREVLFNGETQTYAFEPGLRFATLTWSNNPAFGMMSGYVGAHSFGTYAHFQVNTPFVSDFVSGGRGLAGYNMTFGPVFCHRDFPYVGAYAGLGLGAYVWEPHLGIDYEAGVMGFYKHMVLTLGFHTSRLNSTVKSTNFMVGFGGYLKRYYDDELGYCSSDSRRWLSVNYVFRPSENGKGLMVGDLGHGRVRYYLKALYLSSLQDTDTVRCVEGGLGIIFTPGGIIDMCAGVSAKGKITRGDDRFQGMGVEVGTILNIWRFPITVMLHEVDLFGDRHLCVDFGVGFHLGEFGKYKCSYK